MASHFTWSEVTFRNDDSRKMMMVKRIIRVPGNRATRFTGMRRGQAADKLRCCLEIILGYGEIGFAKMQP